MNFSCSDYIKGVPRLVTFSPSIVWRRKQSTKPIHLERALPNMYVIGHNLSLNLIKTSLVLVLLFVVLQAWYLCGSFPNCLKTLIMET